MLLAVCLLILLYGNGIEKTWLFFNDKSYFNLSVSCKSPKCNVKTHIKSYATEPEFLYRV